jgi:hypothetical protein
LKFKLNFYNLELNDKRENAKIKINNSNRRVCRFYLFEIYNILYRDNSIFLKSELKEHLAKAQHCVLNFTAVWCEPCIKVKEILKVSFS